MSDNVFSDAFGVGPLSVGDEVVYAGHDHKRKITLNKGVIEKLNEDKGKVLIRRKVISRKIYDPGFNYVDCSPLAWHWGSVAGTEASTATEQLPAVWVEVHKVAVLNPNAAQHMGVCDAACWVNGHAEGCAFD
jgi:hypothetical protein